MSDGTLPVGSVVITPNEMFGEMRAISDRLGEVSGKIDNLSSTLNPAIAHLHDVTEQHEAQLRDLAPLAVRVDDIEREQHDAAATLAVLQKLVFMALGMAVLVTAALIPLAAILLH